MSGDEQNAMVPVGSSARGSRPGGRPVSAGRGPGSTEDGDGAGSVEWTPPEAPPVVLFVVTALAATALTLVDLGREAPLVQSLRLGMALVALVTASIARRRPTLALQLLLGAALLALFVFRLAGGAGYWLALVPMVAGFYGGLRTGVGWCAATCVGVLLGPYLDPLVADEVSSAMGRRVVEEVFFVLLMLIFPALADRRRRRELDHLAVTSAALSRANQRLDRAGKQEREARESSERIARAHLALLARLSHEIRTPLSAIQGLVELLKTEPLPVQAKEAVVSIDASTRGLRGLVNDMLDLARIEAGKLVVERIAFDPRSLLEDTVDLWDASHVTRACGESWSTRISSARDITLPFVSKF